MVAVKIQAHIRGSIVRKHFLRRMREKLDASLNNDTYRPLLQRQVKDMVQHALRLKYTDVDRFRSATRLQAWWRMLLVRRCVVVLKAAAGLVLVGSFMTNTATRLQSQWRRKAVSKRLRPQILKNLSESDAQKRRDISQAIQAIVQVQRAFRLHLAFKHVDIRRGSGLHLGPESLTKQKTGLEEWSLVQSHLFQPKMTVDWNSMEPGIEHWLVRSDTATPSTMATCGARSSTTTPSDLIERGASPVVPRPESRLSINAEVTRPLSPTQRARPRPSTAQSQAPRPEAPAAVQPQSPARGKLAHQYPNIGNLIEAGQEPFYSLDKTRAPRHHIGGSQAMSLQCLLNPCGIGDPSMFDTVADIWHLYPHGFCADHVGRLKSGLPPSDRCSSKRNSKQRASSQKQRKLRPTEPAQAPPSHAERRVLARQEVSEKVTIRKTAEVHPLLVAHPTMMDEPLPALNWALPDEDDDSLWGVGMAC